MKIPENLKYTIHDEWVKIDGDVATVGITDYAQDALGDLVYVELPEVGDTFEAGEEAGEVESVKTMSEIYAPVTGEVTETNEDIAENAETINEDPYGKGWLFKMKITDSDSLADLLDAEAYEAKVSD